MLERGGGGELKAPPGRRLLIRFAVESVMTTLLGVI